MSSASDPNSTTRLQARADRSAGFDIPNQREMFPISMVSEATGVPAVTLRAWERRYGFLHPHRTASGRRLYSVEHIGLIRRVVGFLEAGIPVGRVEAILEGESPGERRVPENSWDSYREYMRQAIVNFDERRLDTIYNEVLANHSIDAVTRELIVPVMRRVGEGWQVDATGIAEEHFFGVYIRNKLGSRWHHGEPPAGGRRMIACCLPGDEHEYGLMLFALTARARGLDLILLGGNMPLDVLPVVVKRTRVSGIVLSSTIQPGWQVIEVEIRNLVAESGVPVFVGGGGVLSHGEALQAVGAIPVGSELSVAVESIQKYLFQSNVTVSGSSSHG